MFLLYQSINFSRKIFSSFWNREQTVNVNYWIDSLHYAFPYMIYDITLQQLETVTLGVPLFRSLNISFSQFSDVERSTSATSSYQWTADQCRSWPRNKSTNLWPIVNIVVRVMDWEEEEEEWYSWRYCREYSQGASLAWSDRLCHHPLVLPACAATTATATAATKGVRGTIRWQRLTGAAEAASGITATVTASTTWATTTVRLWAGEPWPKRLLQTTTTTIGGGSMWLSLLNCKGMEGH